MQSPLWHCVWSESFDGAYFRHSFTQFVYSWFITVYLFLGVVELLGCANNMSKAVVAYVARCRKQCCVGVGWQNILATILSGGNGTRSLTNISCDPLVVNEIFGDGDDDKTSAEKVKPKKIQYKSNF